MALRFVKVSEEQIEEAFFYPSDLVNTKTTIPLRVSLYIHHYSPSLRGIVVYYYYIISLVWLKQGIDNPYYRIQSVRK